MRETESSQRPLTPAEKRLDAQMNDYLDRKIVRNFTVANPDGNNQTTESEKEAIWATATRIFSLNEHKISQATGRYRPAVEQQKADLNWLDKQFTRYLDRKILRNIVANTPESRNHVIDTVAIRIFSLDAHKNAATANKYLEEAHRQGKVQINKPKENSKKG